MHLDLIFIVWNSVFFYYVKFNKQIVKKNKNKLQLCGWVGG